MMYEIERKGLCTIMAEDGQEITAREYIVRIPAADEGVSGVGMVSRTVGTKTVATFDAYSVELVDGVPAVKTEPHRVEIEGQPTAEKVEESISKTYPTHGPVSVEIQQGETVGLPADLFRELAVRVIRSASQR